MPVPIREESRVWMKSSVLKSPSTGVPWHIKGEGKVPTANAADVDAWLLEFHHAVRGRGEESPSSSLSHHWLGNPTFNPFIAGWTERICSEGGLVGFELWTHSLLHRSPALLPLDHSASLPYHIHIYVVFNVLFNIPVLSIDNRVSWST